MIDDTENMGVDLRTKAVKDVKGNIYIIEYYVDESGEVRFVSFELWMSGDEPVEGDVNAQGDTTTTA